MKRATWQSLPPSHKAAIEASVLQKMFDTLPGALHEAQRCSSARRWYSG